MKPSFKFLFITLAALSLTISCADEFMTSRNEDDSSNKRTALGRENNTDEESNIESDSENNDESKNNDENKNKNDPKEKEEEIPLEVHPLAAGNGHSCSLQEDTSVKCWGEGLKGYLGNGTINPSGIPVNVLLTGTNTDTSNHLTNVTEISAGSSTCALLSNGKVMCWGQNFNGQVGNGLAGLEMGGETRIQSNPGYVLKSGTSTDDSNHLTGVVSIGSGSTHQCAIVSGGKVMCWGRNVYAELGNGTVGADVPNPTYVLASGTYQNSNHLENAVSVSAGYNFTCALLDTGIVMCWGANTGALGGGQDSVDQRNPGYVLMSGTNADESNHLKNVASLKVYYKHACVILKTDEVMCWGENDRGEAGTGSSGSYLLNPQYVLASGTDQNSNRLGGVRSLSLSFYTTCALLKTQELLCWGVGQGSEAHGQLGEGQIAANRLNPIHVLKTGTDTSSSNWLKDVVSIAAGNYHQCAAISGGQVMCWGFGYLGRLGNGDTSYHDVLNPTLVLSLDD